MTESSKPNNPHDALFKRTFSVVENAVAELRTVLPASVVAEIDFTTLEIVSGAFGCLDRNLPLPYTAVGKITREELISVAEATSQEAKDVAVTLAEQLIAEGVRRGERQGELRGERRALVRVLMSLLQTRQSLGTCPRLSGADLLERTWSNWSFGSIGCWLRDRLRMC